MDTPDPHVIVNARQSRTNVTPKSANFGSPVATQESWTAPLRRRHVQQRAKTSFLAGDEDDHGGEKGDQAHKHAMTIHPDRRKDVPGHNYMSFDFDFNPGHDRETTVDEDGHDQSPTLHASQAARLPPQSAQFVPRSNDMDAFGDDASDVFEALKTPGFKKSPQTHEPPQRKQPQERESTNQDQPARKGKQQPTAKITAGGPQGAARKSRANSNAKLAALEVQEEDDGPWGLRDKASHDRKYSLPASNSSSPAAAPARKKAVGKKQATKKPAAKSKGNAHGAKATARGRTKNEKPAPAPPVRESLDTHLDEKNNDGISSGEELPTVPQEARRGKQCRQPEQRHLELGAPADEDQKEDVVVIPSRSSSPDVGDKDDEDFECSRKMTPGNARHRTRAAAAESPAAKQAKKKEEGGAAALSNDQIHDGEDEMGCPNIAKKPEVEQLPPLKPQPKKQPKTQSKQPHRKTGAHKASAARIGTEAKPESAKETTSSADTPEKKGSSNGHTVANRVTTDKREARQNIVSPNTNRERGEANGPRQVPESVRPTKNPDRKPKIVTFSVAGPKNNGRPHKATVTTKAQPQCHEASISGGEHHGTANTQDTAAGGSLANDFLSHDGDLRGAAAPNRPPVTRAVPGKAPTHEPDIKEISPYFDAETTLVNYEDACGDKSHHFVVSNAEADTAREVESNLAADVPELNSPEAADAFEGRNHVKVKPPVRANPEHMARSEEDTVLREVEGKPQTLPRKVPAVNSRMTKRKLPEVMSVGERSPIQSATASNMGPKTEPFTAMRVHSAAPNSPSEAHWRPAKKPKLLSANPALVNHKSPGAGGGDTSCGDDVFGPGKKGKVTGLNAFVQRLMSNESPDCGSIQAGLAPSFASDERPAARQHVIASNGTQSVVPGTAPHACRRQQLDNVGQRMLAALAPKEAQDAGQCSPDDEARKNSHVCDTGESWHGGTRDQNNNSQLEGGIRAWKKATEPYADCLGETMHKIVNTILRGLKTTEASIDDVIEDYGNDGRRILERMREKHRKERALITRQQEEQRQESMQRYGEARHFARSLLGKLESVDINELMTHAGHDTTTNRLKQLQQAIPNH